VRALKGTTITGEKTLKTIIEETLNGWLERKIKKHVESDICAAHDLAPILEKAFDIEPKELAKDGDLLTILGRSGLDLKDEEDSKGMEKKKFSGEENGKKY
jgi:hypothetical protein